MGRGCHRRARSYALGTQAHQMASPLPSVLSRGRVHNLRDVSLTLYPGQVVVLTGVSGSGKSSLALDTLYAEGQRRFIESFSPYARQFLERLQRPSMDSLAPVAAGIAVERRGPIKSSRSTVATLTDLSAYLAALFRRESTPICPADDTPAQLLTLQGAVNRALERARGRRAIVAYPLGPIDREGYLEVRENLVRSGYRRLWLKGQICDIDQTPPSEVVGTTEAAGIIVDRLVMGDRHSGRIAAAIDHAWQASNGTCHMVFDTDRVVLVRGLTCPHCARRFSPPRPGVFSFESPSGACPTCHGFGRIFGIDLNKVIADPDRSLAQGAIVPWRGPSTAWERGELAKLCRRHRVPTSLPYARLSAEQRRWVLEGDGDWDSGGFPGVMGWFRWMETRTYKMHVRVLLSRYRSYETCPSCQGQRLNSEALTYRVDGRSLADIYAMEAAQVSEVLRALAPQTVQGQLACRELLARLGYLQRAGLGYLQLNRQARTLSGGELQRVTLATALGTTLQNALFVIDEPTVGLHTSDVAPLLTMFQELAAAGNTVLIVEHDPALIGAADRVLELGPGAGEHGGRLVADGTPAAVASSGGATARALAVRSRTQRPSPTPSGWFTVAGVNVRNLKDIEVRIPLGVLCAVAGPSGSGKSTLAIDVVAQQLLGARANSDPNQERPSVRKSGHDAVGTVVVVDQSPLGRTSRGNAATYTKAWDILRARLGREPAAVAAGFSPSSFSFNVKGGRCEACSGNGCEIVEMQFLADVRLTCAECGGRRFRPEVCAVRHRGWTVDGLLDATVQRVLDEFGDDGALVGCLTPLKDLGLGYLRLGQPLSTLSGGEAQRMKLARALATALPSTLYVFDEPSAGLHVDEIRLVLDNLRGLVDRGCSVLLVEHDLDLIWGSDWVIELGPGAGAHGGRVVAQGYPWQLRRARTRTGAALRSRPSLRRGHGSPAVDHARELRVERAREHNLKEVSCAIPHGQLTVVTGPSGSGKSTLAFDVVFSECQRRFLETITPYARQFLPALPRPDVDSVTGIPPAVALEQRTSRASVHSTVATVTEVAHYLRLLYARLGVPYCPDHGERIQPAPMDSLLATLRRIGGKFELLAPVVRERKGLYQDLFAAAARAGIEAAWCDGQRVQTDAPPRLQRSREHQIDLIVASPWSHSRAGAERVREALEWGGGEVKIRLGNGKTRLLSLRNACPKCNLSVSELDPRWFSASTRQGRCPNCRGLGWVEARTRKQSSLPRTQTTCSVCKGTRLSPIARAVRLDGESISDMLARSVISAEDRIANLNYSKREAPLVRPIVTELRRRLAFLSSVGLDYLTLDRPAQTLSGGEMQRLRLAAQLGAGLTGALYVLDEPTIGLHGVDTARLLGNIRDLVALGSTVVVVEHDIDTIIAADHLIDLGPGGGTRGGTVVASGTPKEVLAHPHSPTGRALAHPPRLRTPVPVGKRDPMLVLEGASEHNLRNVRLRLPLGRFVVVCGVSGSGKSTLVRRVLLAAVQRQLGRTGDEPGTFRRLQGYEPLKRAVAVDQSPIGRTPRSVPATFLGIWDTLRQLFALTPEARALGFGPTQFSFNSPKGGRCETCAGQGVITEEMSFLPDVVTPCPACGGRRFDSRTLEVRYLGLDIAQVLDLTAEQAMRTFEHHPVISNPLRTLFDLGAGYIRIGQGSHTLSGGEAQRLKLATELTASARHEPTLYVLDEPTTGLHVGDVSRLIDVLGRLVKRGDTLVVIEHHPMVIGGADYVVELGPGGGEKGGRVIAAGVPAEIAAGDTPTARVLLGAQAGLRGFAGSAVS